MDTYEENNIPPLPDQEPIQPQPAPDQLQRFESALEEILQSRSEAQEEDCAPQADISASAGEELQIEDVSDGFYHGVGTGVTESTFTCSIPTEEPPVQEEPPVESPVEASVPRKPKKKIGKKILKMLIAGAVVLGLVVTGCGVTMAVTSFYWHQHNETLMKNFEEQIDVMRKELEQYKDADVPAVVVPQEGMTPSQIYQQNIHSVVVIECIAQRNQNGQVVEGISAGSGFVLTADGYIVTNQHVVEGATSVTVSFANGKQMSATVIGSDAVNDIALLKVAATGLKPVTIGSSKALRVGEQVVAIGNALGELSFSLTVGYVSGIDRSISTDGSISNMIQTDASINSGNSGGPLFNSRGEVVGIITAKYSGATASGASIEGVGFALPIDDVIGMLQDLRQYGYITGAYLGVMVQDVDPATAEAYGVPMGAYVREVTPGYAAQKAGLRAKDIITNLGGYEVTCMSDLTRILRNFRGGDETTIVIWRSGQRMVFNIVLDEKPR
jgi:serine protease Do